MFRIRAQSAIRAGGVSIAQVSMPFRKHEIAAQQRREIRLKCCFQRRELHPKTSTVLLIAACAGR
jgi:hypothetical protein